MQVATPARVPSVTRARDFEGFYRRERALLYRALALTLADRQLAAEAVDEAMVRAYQRWSSVSRYDNAAGWVYRVALNWALSHKRRRPPRLPGPVPGGEPQLPDQALDQAVAQLPAEQRAVVVLRFFLDWPLEQIAVALGVPVGTVKSRLHRALATLRQTLGDDHES